MAKLEMTHAEAGRILKAFTDVDGLEVNEKGVAFSGKGFALKLDELNLKGSLNAGDIDFDISAQSQDGRIEIELK